MRRFDMATIVGTTSKYGDGHQVILRSKLSSTVRNTFLSNGYVPGESVFTITQNPQLHENVKNNIQIFDGPGNIFLLDVNQKVVHITGNVKTINKSFNHFTKNTKSLTSKLAVLRETISMWMIKSLIENNILLSEQDIIQKLDDSQRKLYITIFYQSSFKQAIELKNIVKGNGYSYELQGGPLTKKIYKNARILSGKHKDHWNPADIWMIKKGYDISKLYCMDDLNELNNEIVIGYNNGNIIPVSLKQVTSLKAKSTVIDPTSILSKKLDFDFDFEKVDFSGKSYTEKSFANFHVETKSGFAVRGGFKSSSSTFNVSLEGKWIGTGYQLGAVDAKTYPVHIKESFGYILRNGTNVTVAEQELAKKELKEIYDTYPKISKSMPNYQDAIDLFLKGDDFTKNRFANIVSYLYSFLIVPLKSKNGFEHNMSFCYFSAKKLTSGSSLYVILENG